MPSRSENGASLFTRDRRGMSLVELLVAMAIFAALVSGLMLLFSGAIGAMRTNEQLDDMFTNIRGALIVLDRDLANAFSARERGDSFEFYGGPKGFTFIGVTEDGTPARITYVAHPTAETIQFQGQFVETYGILHDRALDQGGKDLLDAFVALVGNQLPTTVDTTVRSDQLVKALRDTLVDVPAVYLTQSLVRLIEPGVTDLDAFDIIRADNERVPWPSIDVTINPNLPLGSDYYLEDDADNLRLYLMTLEGINPQAVEGDALDYETDLGALLDSVDPISDLRTILIEERAKMQALTRDDIEAIVRAKRRELWVRMLAGEQGLPQFWGNIDDASDARPKAEDYVVADNLAYRVYMTDLPEFDLLGTPGLFSYGNSVPEYIEQFNDVRCITMYPDFQESADRDTVVNSVSIADPDSMDEYLAEEQKNNAPALGSPLAPRLPAFMRAGCWVVEPSAWVGGKDAIRWFTQEINVPTAASRGLPSALQSREKT